VLIAQLSTSAGLRAPLSQVADRVFLDLSREIESQGVSRKVAADMFGMALRGYQRKVQRLQESLSVQGRTLWEAVLDHLERHGGSTLGDLLARFAPDGEEHLRAVLRDLQRNGLVYATGRGSFTVYGLSSSEDLARMRGQDGDEALRPSVWLAVHERSRSPRELAAALGAAPEAVLRVAQALHAEGLLTSDAAASGTVELDSVLSSQRFLIPVGTEHGWEEAVFDHFRAVATAIAAKLRSAGPRSSRQDVVGGATLAFELGPSHPMREEVLGLLSRVRAELNEVWERHSAHNRQHPIAEDERTQVTFYFGQNVEPVPLQEGNEP
jgi:hypothetical protein